MQTKHFAHDCAPLAKALDILPTHVVPWPTIESGCCYGTCMSSMAGLSLKLTVCNAVPDDASQILMVLSADAVAMRRLSPIIGSCYARTAECFKTGRD